MTHAGRTAADRRTSGEGGDDPTPPYHRHLAPSIASAVYAYSIKYETLYYAEQVAKLKAKVQRERDAIAVLQAEWQLLEPARPPAGGGGQAPRPAAPEDPAARAPVRPAEPAAARGRDRPQARSSRPSRADSDAEGQKPATPARPTTQTPETVSSVSARRFDHRRTARAGQEPARSGRSLRAHAARAVSPAARQEHGARRPRGASASSALFAVDRRTARHARRRERDTQRACAARPRPRSPPHVPTSSTATARCWRPTSRWSRSSPSRATSSTRTRRSSF